MNIEILYRWACELHLLLGKGDPCPTTVDVGVAALPPPGWHMVDGRGLCPIHRVLVQPRGGSPDPENVPG